jgi:hypothetical protein
VYLLEKVIACSFFCVSEKQTCACLIELLHDNLQEEQEKERQNRKTDRQVKLKNELKGGKGGIH